MNEDRDEDKENAQLHNIIDGNYHVVKEKRWLDGIMPFDTIDRHSAVDENYDYLPRVCSDQTV